MVWGNWYFAYPCRSSEIVSSIKAVLSRLKPPTLKLMPPDDLELKFPPSVNPCRSNVPKGFFIFTDFVSFKLSVRFWRKSPPPRQRHETKGKKVNLFFRLRRLNENGLSEFFTFLLPSFISPALSSTIKMKTNKLQTNFINI